MSELIVEESNQSLTHKFQDMHSLVVSFQSNWLELCFPPHLKELALYFATYQMVPKILTVTRKTLKELVLAELQGDISDFNLDYKMESKFECPLSMSSLLKV